MRFVSGGPRSKHALCLLVVTTSVASCSGPSVNPASAVRPPDKTYADVSPPRACTIDDASAAEPLVVDWTAEDRGELEISMKQGVAVVRYDCKTMQLLRDCKVDGTYGFIGMQTKQNVVQLVDAQEIRTNLPKFGPTFAAQLGAELERGTSLDVGMVMVGKRRTTWMKVSHADLAGPDCGSATHFVRGALVGAFALDTGSRAKIAAVAKLFGGGGEGASTSEKRVRNQDGSLESCEKADPDSPKAPTQCGAPIRLELVPLTKGVDATARFTAAQGGNTKPSEETLVACPSGMVRSEGKCTSPKTETTHLCKADDKADCVTQCGRSHWASCSVLGLIHWNEQNRVEAGRALDVACRNGESTGCVNMGRLLRSRMQGMAPEPAKANEYSKKACADGVAAGCADVGYVLFRGEGAPIDNVRAAAYLTHGCNGGDGDACSLLGSMQLTGLGVPKDVVRAAATYKRACDGGNVGACDNYGYAFEQGLGVRKDPAMAFKIYSATCPTGSAFACAMIATFYETGGPVPKDAAKAMSFWEKSLAGDDKVPATSVLNALYGRKLVAPEDAVQASISAWSQTCAQNEPRDCVQVGLVEMLGSDKERGRENVRKSCRLGDRWGCEVERRLGATNVSLGGARSPTVDGASKKPVAIKATMAMPTTGKIDGPKLVAEINVQRAAVSKCAAIVRQTDNVVGSLNVQVTIDATGKVVPDLQSPVNPAAQICLLSAMRAWTIRSAGAGKAMVLLNLVDGP